MRQTQFQRMLRNREVGFSQAQIDEYAEKILQKSHFDLAYLWQYTSDNLTPLKRADLITSSGKSLHDIFTDRLFNHFGGITPELSKQLYTEFGR